MPLGSGFFLLSAFSVPAIAQSQPKDVESTFPACTKQPNDAQSDEAHKRYLLGKDAYDASDWEVALRYFSDAYRADCTKHELLVIISRAHEQRRELREAIDTLKLYLKRATNVSVSDKDTYERRIRKLEGDLAKAPPPTTAPTTTTAPTATTAPTTTNTVVPPPPERGHSPFPFILGGLGAATIIVGAVVYIAAPDKPNNCDDSIGVCTRRPNETDSQYADDQTKANRSKDLPIVGGAVIAGGALMLVGGVIWFLVEPTTSKSGQNEKSKLRFTPELSPSYGGFSLTKSF